MERASIAFLLFGAVMLSSIFSVAVAETGTLGVYVPPKPSPFMQAVPPYYECGNGWNLTSSLKSDEAIFRGSVTTCGWTYVICRHSDTSECYLDTKVPRKIVKVVGTCPGCDTFLVSQGTFNQVAGQGASPGFAIDYTRIIID